MKPVNQIFAQLEKSTFRRRFHLRARDRAYIERKSLPIVLDHARDFILKRLASANPINDGKQTPFSGHPVFVAQHATATCCRSCLSKWHNIPVGQELSDQDRAHILTVLERWLREELRASRPEL